MNERIVILVNCCNWHENCKGAFEFC